ncbi:hypothetical protein CHLRE_11g467697v5 [Chlamydomonas reinhardtii]|uniref:Uncharacterized protein n=2 Tax=Chlamydomonas reinhardtii TaxID=3055 RepID=A0A2K3D7Q9_CHLRE|nr:uncharacterized protein CHLRE_11g467697v5 [Chlamydomonas reinhardtii]PNW76567.1 hypothetical protein CHLRE_11g467697v5 [Chlamydomonas reinhardtii]
MQVLMTRVPGLCRAFGGAMCDSGKVRCGSASRVWRCGVSVWCYRLAGRPEREECASANFQPASKFSGRDVNSATNIRHALVEMLLGHKRPASLQNGGGGGSGGGGSGGGGGGSSGGACAHLDSGGGGKGHVEEESAAPPKKRCKRTG